MTASNDSAELEALFDSISADISVPTPPVAAVAARLRRGNRDANHRPAERAAGTRHSSRGR